MDVKGNFSQASSDKPKMSLCFKVVNCKYDYADIIEIVKDKDYKYLILQFHALKINTGHPLFTAIAYPKKKGNDYGKQYQLKAVDGEMKIDDDTSAILGNNILDLDKLRDLLKDPSGGYIKFDFLKFSPRIQYKYSGHIIYDAEPVSSLSGTGISLPCDPCPPACPVG
ncbi:MAG TPA: hypothetical protein VNR87_08995 [Flavisolibacter sp.]|nr:hypothetical protein [Flavisolibacter sp.]